MFWNLQTSAALRSSLLLILIIANLDSVLCITTLRTHWHPPHSSFRFRRWRNVRLWNCRGRRRGFGFRLRCVMFSKLAALRSAIAPATCIAPSFRVCRDVLHLILAAAIPIVAVLGRMPIGAAVDHFCVWCQTNGGLNSDRKDKT